jgi:hypothetical protein
MSVEIRDERRSVTKPDTAAATAEPSGPLSHSGARLRPVTLLGDVRLLLIAVWLGAAVFFFAVAQSAFAVLPTRELAGAMVGRTLAILNVGGFVISLVLLASVWVARNRSVRGALLLRAETASLLAMALATGVGHWFITARLAALRAAAGRPLDELARNDPLRVAFGSLHFYSVIVLCVAVTAAAVCLFSIARRARHHS